MFCSVPGLGREGRALPQAQTAGVTLPHPPRFLLGRGGGAGGAMGGRLGRMLSLRSWSILSRPWERAGRRGSRADLL